MVRLFTGWFPDRQPEAPVKPAKRVRVAKTKPALLNVTTSEVKVARPRKGSVPKVVANPLTIPPQPGKRIKFTQAHRYLVWNTQIGRDSAHGPCWCCQTDVNFQDYEIGHLRSLAEGGANNVTNLVVLCRSCNRSMGTADAHTFRLQLTGQ